MFDQITKHAKHVKKLRKFYMKKNYWLNAYISKQYANNYHKQKSYIIYIYIESTPKNI
jgi:hypothetical protein